MRLIKMGKKMIKEEMENSIIVTCHFWQDPWWRNKGETQKKMAPPHLYAIHAKLSYQRTFQFPHGICSKESCKEEKHSRKWHHLPLCSACQMCDYHTGGHSNYLTISTVKTAAKKKTQQEDGPTQPLCHTCQMCDYHTRGHAIASQYAQ